LKMRSSLVTEWTFALLDSWIMLTLDSLWYTLVLKQNTKRQGQMGCGTKKCTGFKSQMQTQDSNTFLCRKALPLVKWWVRGIVGRLHLLLLETKLCYNASMVLFPLSAEWGWLRPLHGHGSIGPWACPLVCPSPKQQYMLTALWKTGQHSN